MTLERRGKRKEKNLKRKIRTTIEVVQKYRYKDEKIKEIDFISGFKNFIRDIEKLGETIPSNKYLYTKSE